MGSFSDKEQEGFKALWAAVSKYNKEEHTSVSAGTDLLKQVEILLTIIDPKHEVSPFISVVKDIYKERRAGTWSTKVSVSMPTKTGCQDGYPTEHRSKIKGYVWEKKDDALLKLDCQTSNDLEDDEKLALAECWTGRDGWKNCSQEYRRYLRERCPFLSDHAGDSVSSEGKAADTDDDRYSPHSASEHSYVETESVVSGCWYVSNDSKESGDS